MADDPGPDSRAGRSTLVTGDRGSYDITTDSRQFGGEIFGLCPRRGSGHDFPLAAARAGFGASLRNKASCIK